jgi:hypothetical protein
MGQIAGLFALIDTSERHPLSEGGDPRREGCRFGAGSDGVNGPLTECNMAQDAVIDATFDALVKVVDLLEELDNRYIVRSVIQVAVKTTKTSIDDAVVAAAIRVADAIGPNKAKVTEFLNWLRVRAKGTFASAGELDFGCDCDEEACTLAVAAATNWAEA